MNAVYDEKSVLKVLAVIFIGWTPVKQLFFFHKKIVPIFFSFDRLNNMNSQSTNGEGATMSSIPSFSQHRLNTEDQDGPSFLNRSGGGFYPDASSFSRSAKESVEELCRVWMNERNAPELLPYEHSLVEPLIASIISQVYVNDICTYIKCHQNRQRRL